MLEPYRNTDSQEFRMSDSANKVCVRLHFEELWNNGQLDRIDDFFAKEFMNFGQQHQDGRTIVKHIVTVWRTPSPTYAFRWIRW